MEDTVPDNVAVGEPECSSDSGSPQAPVPLPDPETIMTFDSDTPAVTFVDSPTAPTMTSADVVTDHRSRAGPLLRPVTRLLEMMQQRPVSVP